jgi:hypothetical protein
MSRLRPPDCGMFAQDQRDFDHLCKASIDIAEALSRRLKRVQGREWKKDQFTGRISAGRALRTVWAENDIKDLQNRLSKLRDEVEIRLLVDLR